MNRYEVTWGEESSVVAAPNEKDAWSKFVEGHDLAAKHPELHERVIEVVEEAEVVEDEESTEQSPVVDQTADEARDHISRMRSAEKLQEIIDTDQRVTVQEAARKRLAELGDN